MSRQQVRVTRNSERKSRLPERYAEYAAMLVVLEAVVGLPVFSQLLRLNRSRGYQGLDVFLSLLGYHTGDGKGGLRGWLEAGAVHGGRLAGLAGRAKLMTQASMSRALASVSAEQVDDFGAQMLCHSSLGEQLLNSPTVLHRDTHGGGWHVFDFDPTAKAMRERALPEGEDLPPSRRRGAGLATPGYTGRKRGELVMNYGILDHGGAGLWMGCWGWAGPGAPRDVRLAAVRRITHIADRFGLQRSHCLLRTDGGVSGFPIVSACVDAGIGLLTRFPGHAVYDAPEVRPMLADPGGWVTVEDSGSGPTRQAKDLGRILMTSDERDGPRRSVRVRVVASRFPVETVEYRGAGRVIDGWCYEAFIALVPADAFPASEVVSLYCARAGQENRFARLDAGYELKRTFSGHLPGQLLVVAVGLLVDNLRTVFGARLIDELGSPDPQAPRPARPVSAASARAPIAPAPAPEPVETDTALPEGGVSLRGLTRHARRELAAAADWETAARAKGPGWKTGTDPGTIECPAGHAMGLKAVSQQTSSTVRIRMQAKMTNCRGCALRPGCTDSTNPKFTNEVSTTLPVGAAMAVLQAIKREGDIIRDGGEPGRRVEPYWTPAEDTGSGQLETSAPVLFVPEVRRCWTNALRALTVLVTVRGAFRQRPVRSPWLRQTPASRQGRRRTWAARIAERALPDTAVVYVTLRGGEPIAGLVEATKTTGKT